MLKGHCDRALIPIENHYTKRTRILYDLICKYNMHIVDEVFLNINHALLAKEGTKLSDIQVIASHIQVPLSIHFDSVRFGSRGCFNVRDILLKIFQM